MRKIIFYILLSILLLAGGFVAVGMYAGALANQARFNVDALARYVVAYQAVEGKTIESLGDLPDFEIISSAEGFLLRSREIRKVITGGYAYDLQSSGGGKFLISASPVGWFSSGYEFGIMEDGELRMNNKDADASVDLPDELQGWRKISRADSMRTRQLPAYLR